MSRNFKSMFPNKYFLFFPTETIGRRRQNKNRSGYFYFQQALRRHARCPPKDPANSNMAVSVRVCCALRNVVGGELFLFLILHNLVISGHCIYLCTFSVSMLTTTTVWQWLVPFTDLGQNWHCWRSVKIFYNVRFRTHLGRYSSHRSNKSLKIARPAYWASIFI